MLGSSGHSGSACSNTRRSEVEATRSLIADLSWNNLSWQQAKTVLLGAQKAPDSRFFELPQVLVAKILKMAHRPQWQPWPPCYSAAVLLRGLSAGDADN